MTVSVTEAKNKLTQLLTAVEKASGPPIAEIVQPSAKRVPKFGTLKGTVHMTAEEILEATRPMTDDEVDSFLQGRY